MPARHAITTPKLAKLMRKSQPVPMIAMRTPAIAGPTMRAIWNVVELSATALERLESETSSDTKVWRTGANSATTLTTEVALTIGGKDVPAGAYSLYTVREGGKYWLIINNNTGQWGTDYDASKDFARVELTMRTLHETMESLQIAMVPPMSGPPAGALTIAWGKLHLSTQWTVKP